MTQSARPFTFLGGASRGGTYLLRMEVAAPLRVRFGRFRQGQPLALPAGSYLYVGSALAQKGHASLARRLLRHATRSGERPFHPIRAQMVRLFPQVGLADAPLRPPPAKKLHWHVDYLLDETAVSLTHVIILRRPQPLETAVAQMLLADTAVTTPIPGLGAQDHPHATHLVRVPGDAAWQEALPARLLTLLARSE